MKCKEAIKQVIDRHDLTREQAYHVACDIMKGKATPVQVGGFIVSLRMKGETIEEITGFVQAMREVVTPVRCQRKDIIDTSGTGGDRLQTFNISTVAALVAAGAGCAVAKHGNRAVSSSCGSADILEQLGVNIKISPDTMAACIDKAGIGFLFAPLLHKAMKYAIGPRKEIGVRTVFNILGPLTNPANTQYQLLGVFDDELTEPLARVLYNLGSKHAMVVHGNDGLDEITISAGTRVSELLDGQINTYEIIPEDYGIKRASLEQIQVNTMQDSIKYAMAVLKKQDGPQQDIVLLNAGAAIYIAGKANSLEQGVEQARESIYTGKAKECLDRLRKIAS
jgi:anthranilate phosphoribosyltransferase